MRTSRNSAKEGRHLIEFTGRPQSAVWRGGALHLRSPHGGAGAPELHAHFAVQLSVAMAGDVQFSERRGERPRQAPGWLVGSDRPHRMVSPSTQVIVFWDPVTSDGRRIVERLQGCAAASLTSEERSVVCRRLEQMGPGNWRPSALRAAAHDVAATLSRDRGRLVLDARVQRVIDRLARDPSEHASLNELAAEVGLSESRLAHLFRIQVGIPMRQYRLTLRMQNAIREISRGRSLTQTAHLAGFSDSAHFCRVCRRMFGVAPSSLPGFEFDGR